eukprot:gene21267-biopygen8631
MGLGPHPVARARRGLRNCRAAPPLGAGGCPVERARRGPRNRGAAPHLRPHAWRRRARSICL